MPSIEIACVGLKHTMRPPPTTFDIADDGRLVSHRMPSRFQTDFDAINGTLYHLGNPHQNAAASGAFTAFDILSDE